MTVAFDWPDPAVAILPFAPENIRLGLQVYMLWVSIFRCHGTECGSR